MVHRPTGRATSTGGESLSGHRNRFGRLAGALTASLLAVGTLGSVAVVSAAPASASPSIPAAREGASEVVSSSGVIDASCGAGLPNVTPFTTIQAAVNAASPTAIIYVCAGTYNENVSINQVVYIFGTQWSVPTGAGNTTARTDPTAESTLNGSIQYTAGATSGALVGLTVNGDGTDPAVTAEDVGNNWTWENNIVDVSNGGFLFNTDGAANPATSTVSGNRFTQATPSSAGSGWSGSGVAFYGGTNSTGNNVTISDNDFEDSTGPAGAISANAFGSSAGCTSTTSAPSGPSQAYFSNDLGVTGNTFEFAGSTGSNYESNAIVAMCTTNAQVTGNTVTDAAAGDALASSAFYFGGGDWNSTISGNTLTGGGATDASGINVNSDYYPPGTGISVTANTVSGYLYGIHVKGSLSGFTVNSNTVSGSGAAGIQVESGDTNGSVAGNTVSATGAGPGNADCVDNSSGAGSAGTANTWSGNAGTTSSPVGLCGPLPTIPPAREGVSEVVSNSGVIDATCGSGLPHVTPFTSIQAAVNAASTGTIIYVCAGTYNESLSISKTVYLFGAQWSVPVGAGLDAARTNTTAETTIDSASGALNYGGSGIAGVADGFTFTGRGGAGGAAAINAHDAGQSFQWNNDIFTANQAGINFNTAPGAAASTITDDRFLNNNAPGGTQGTGIFFTNGPADNVTISNNSFEQDGHDNGDINTTGQGNCDSNSNPASALYSQNLVVTGNVAVQSAAAENNFLVLFCSNNAQVTNNTVTDTTPADPNADTALYISGGNSGTHVSGNTLQGGGSTDASGISLNDQFYNIFPGYAPAAVSTNIISGWNNGIKVINGSGGSWTGATLSSNTISHSTLDGITVGAGNTANAFYSNTVSTSGTFDCADASTGAGSAGTANTWSFNAGTTSAPSGLCAPLPAIPAAREGASEVVSNTGTIDASCGAGLPNVTPFTTIQAAVNTAGPTAIIYVCAGVYPGNVTINKVVYIFGTQWSVPAGAGDAAVRTSKAPESTVDGSLQYAPGATSGALVGLTLNGNGSSPAVTAEDVGNNWTWENNIVDVSAGGFLYNTDGAANPAATTVSGNRFTQATPSSAGSGWAGSGSAFYGGTNSTGNNVTISGNDFQHSTGPAGAISANAFGSSAGCTSTTSAPSGASQAYFSNGLVVTGNSFEFAGSTGSNYESNAIVAMCTTNAQVTGNTVTDTAPNDALASSAFYFGGGDWNSTISGNTLTSAGAPDASGINVNSDFYPAGTGISVTGNHVAGYLYDIHVKGSLSAFTVSANTATAAGSVGIQVESGDARGLVTGNTVAGSGTTDCVDNSSGTGTSGTANTWTSNAGSTSSPVGLCGVAVTAVTPNGGPAAGGNTVTVTGVGFTGATLVKFGSVAGTGLHVLSGTSLTVVAPAGTVGTVVNVVVTAPLGTSAVSNADHYGYIAPPVVTKDSPFTGPISGATLVTITGTGLGGATGVTFGTTAATSFTVVSSTSITALSPPEAVGTVNVTVTNLGGTSPVVVAAEFTYYAPVPTISSISPTAGTAGTSVTISGTGFLGATTVDFGTIPSTSITVTSNTSITAIAPVGVAKSVVDVKVTGPGGTSALISSDQFTYGPVVTSVSPNIGSHLGGTLVTVKGAGFTGTSSVHFGTTAVTSAITVNAAGTQITVNAPAHVAGAADITVTVGSTTSNTSSLDLFTYV